MAGPILSLNNIEVVYDYVSLAIKGVSLAVPEGGMVGAPWRQRGGQEHDAKSISGLLTAERGEVRRGELSFLREDIGALPPQERVRLGIAHVLEGRRVFEHLTPDENLVAASAMRSRHDVARNRERVYGYFPRLYERRSSEAGLSVGRRDSRCWRSAAP